MHYSEGTERTVHCNITNCVHNPSGKYCKYYDLKLSYNAGTQRLTCQSIKLVQVVS